MFYAENYAGFKKILERVQYYNQQAKVGSAESRWGVGMDTLGHVGSFVAASSLTQCAPYITDYVEYVLQSDDAFKGGNGLPTHYATLHQRDMLSNSFGATTTSGSYAEWETGLTV